MDAAEASNLIQKRTKNIESTFLFSIYRNVCRSLFEKDKLLFSFLLCVRIKQARKDMDMAEWQTLLTLGNMVPDIVPNNPGQPWLDQRSWEACVSMSKLPVFAGLPADMQANIQSWQAFYNAPDPYSYSLHGEWSKINRCVRAYQLI